MRLNMLSVALTAALSLGGAAFAGTTTTTTTSTTMMTPKVAEVMAPATKTETIRSINAKGMYVVLKDGWKYHLPAGFKLAGFKVGEKVTVTYTISHLHHQVSALSAA